jgi:nicotinamidase/pyrazinamidase
VKKAKERKIRLAAGDALILVDVQNDFLPGGRVPVPHGDTVIPVLNDYLEEFVGRQLPVYVTRDWHPANHCSFQTEGGCRPVHCVANSQGAAFPAGLILPPWTVVISKGVVADKEASSGFEETCLERRLGGHGIRRLFVGGLATDCCVLNTIKEALARQFEVFLLRDAIPPLSAKIADSRDAEAEIVALGAVPIRFEKLVRMNS